jgi:hypothetical protein
MKSVFHEVSRTICRLAFTQKSSVSLVGPVRCIVTEDSCGSGEADNRF